MLDRLKASLFGNGGGGDPTEGRPLPGHVLYHFTTCPFCVRVRSAAHRLGFDLEMKNIRADVEARQELIEGGGSQQVPCLRIEGDDGAVEWLYESADIVRYLEQRAAEPAPV